jgi:hypothetical protein
MPKLDRDLAKAGGELNTRCAVLVAVGKGKTQWLISQERYGKNRESTMGFFGQGLQYGVCPGTRRRCFGAVSGPW